MRSLGRAFTVRGPQVLADVYAGRWVRRQVVSQWMPETLFSAGQEGGIWVFDTDVFQVSDGTTQSAALDPAAHIGDLSGNGNHLTQPDNDDYRPARAAANGSNVVQFDLVDDYLKIPFSMSGKRWLVGAAYETDGLQNRMSLVQSPASGRYGLHALKNVTNTSWDIGGGISALWADGVLGVQATKGDLWDLMSVAGTIIYDCAPTTGWDAPEIGFRYQGNSNCPQNMVALLVAEITEDPDAATISNLHNYLNGLRG